MNWRDVDILVNMIKAAVTPSCIPLDSASQLSNDKSDWQPNFIGLIQLSLTLVNDVEIARVPNTPPTARSLKIHYIQNRRIYTTRLKY